MWNQRTGKDIQNGTERNIICEINGGLQISGSCADDEYCAGPSKEEDSICGKDNLCTKKGKHFGYMLSSEGMLFSP